MEAVGNTAADAAAPSMLLPLQPQLLKGVPAWCGGGDFPCCYSRLCHRPCYHSRHLHPPAAACLLTAKEDDWPLLLLL